MRELQGRIGENDGLQIVQMIAEFLLELLTAVLHCESELG